MGPHLNWILFVASSLALAQLAQVVCSGHLTPRQIQEEIDREKANLFKDHDRLVDFLINLNHFHGLDLDCDRRWDSRAHIGKLVGSFRARREEAILSFLQEPNRSWSSLAEFRAALAAKHREANRGAGEIVAALGGLCGLEADSRSAQFLGHKFLAMLEARLFIIETVRDES